MTQQKIPACYHTHKHTQNTRCFLTDQSLPHTHAHTRCDTAYFKSNNLFQQRDVVITIKGVKEKITIRVSLKRDEIEKCETKGGRNRMSGESWRSWAGLWPQHTRATSACLDNKKLQWGSPSRTDLVSGSTCCPSQMAVTYNVIMWSKLTTAGAVDVVDDCSNQF